ncbi:hypothetical protein BDF20DRAFT_530888 [Mycotypha africana]|uniref:uncharacterized protein n=1 Tax=Mycotypha africana TaxID=64632 RepID=UPI0023013216|nr:uncharacterized protein BDF20DRAFT_530888 [Mycotypha africana]KAI8979773.1 hypothetical protein BDF20DRAFT_530888 [Mycotypha africana]
MVSYITMYTIHMAYFILSFGSMHPFQRYTSRSGSSYIFGGGFFFVFSSFFLRFLSKSIYRFVAV